MPTTKRLITSAVLACIAGAACADDGVLTVDAGRRGNAVSPSLYGIFFEEINHSGDGGLYGELIENRSFEDTEPPAGWTVTGGRLSPRKARHHFTGITSDRTFAWPKSKVPGWRLDTGKATRATMEVTKESPLYASAPNNLKLSVAAAPGPVRLVNDGFWGISVKAGRRYVLRTIVRLADTYGGSVRARLLSAEGRKLASADIKPERRGEWSDLTVTLEPTATDANASLALEFDAAGTVWLDYVSLFPEATFRGRKNGMRADLAQMLADMRPAFMRWPGGSIVGGITLDNRFDWKKTLGDPASRPGVYITWGEHCSYGFGYHEMLQFCEDLGMAAMYVCNAGMADMFRSGELCPDDSICHFIDDCLDAIEYAVGGVDTEWGARRAAAGHPEPFPLRYVEVGNEHYGPEYEERFNLFYDAIKARYPEITVVSNLFINGLGKVKKADMVDPHWYGSPNFYFNNADLFDSLPRNGSTIYIGEWACNYKVGRGNMRAALAEAAFLTGVERNADLVTMTSYAPLLQNRHDKDWNVNLIWYDSDSVVGRASYYVQCMAAANRADYNVAVSDSRKTAHVRMRPGKVGFGSSKSPVDIKNVTITAGGRTVAADLACGKAVSGEWAVGDDGVLRQTSERGNSLYVLDGFEGDSFVLECDVRRNSFTEGPFVFFGITDNIREAVRYGVGGWNCELITATRLYDGLDVGAVGRSAKCSLMPGIWHHVRLEVTPYGSTITVNGRDSLSYSPAPTPRHFVCAGMDESRGELVIKVVNPGNEPYSPIINIIGLGGTAVEGKAIVLSASDGNAENSFADAKKVHPEESRITFGSTAFRYTFKPLSYTILRLKPQKLQ